MDLPDYHPNQQLIVIAGPTASGKSNLGLELAEAYNGEIICADSRTVYKGMDIGTAKPTVADRQRVPHHLLDVVNPGERFTAADFQRLAREAIIDIVAKDKVPFVVGGTGLYIDALTLEFDWPRITKTDSLEHMSIENLQMMIKNQHQQLPLNYQNKRHLINVIQRHTSQAYARQAPRQNTHVVAISTPKDELKERIYRRARQMFASNIVQETQLLADTYGWNNEALTGNIYPIVRRLINGEISYEQAIELFVIRDRQLAKRQITWLKRHDYIKWLSLSEARDYISGLLER